MLILVGATLSITFGENGIFSQSKYAVQKYENARLKEDEELQKASDEIEKLGVVSNRDETEYVKKSDYDDLKRQVEELKGQINNENGLVDRIEDLENDSTENVKRNIRTISRSLSTYNVSTSDTYEIYTYTADKPQYVYASFTVMDETSGNTSFVASINDSNDVVLARNRSGTATYNACNATTFKELNTNDKIKFSAYIWGTTAPKVAYDIVIIDK